MDDKKPIDGKPVPQFYGIKYSKDAREINWALKTFIELVRDNRKNEISDDLLELVADGVDMFLKDGTPWTRAIDHKPENDNKIGLMLALNELGVKQQELADDLGISKARVSQMLNNKPLADPRGFEVTGRNFHKSIYLKMYEKKQMKLGELRFILQDQFGKYQDEE